MCIFCAFCQAVKEYCKTLNWIHSINRRSPIRPFILFICKDCGKGPFLNIKDCPYFDLVNTIMGNSFVTALKAAVFQLSQSSYGTRQQLQSLFSPHFVHSDMASLHQLQSLWAMLQKVQVRTVLLHHDLPHCFTGCNISVIFFFS